MSCVNVTGVVVLDNPSRLNKSIRLVITFESLVALKHDIDWRLIYCCSDYFDKNTSSSSSCATISTNASSSSGSTSSGITASATISSSTSNSSSAENSSSSSDKYDEVVLDEVGLGPIPRGSLEFEFDVKPPDYTKLNAENLLEMHALLLSASYKGNEFIRIGWYIHVHEDSALPRNILKLCQEHNIELCSTTDANSSSSSNDEILDYDKLIRYIYTDEARVTRFSIPWDDEPCRIDPLVEDEGAEEKKDLALKDEPKANTTKLDTNTNSSSTSSSCRETMCIDASDESNGSDSTAASTSTASTLTPTTTCTSDNGDTFLKQMIGSSSSSGFAGGDEDVSMA